MKVNVIMNIPVTVQVDLDADKVNQWLDDEGDVSLTSMIWDEVDNDRYAIVSQGSPSGGELIAAEDASNNECLCEW